jgi:hypothetical protein
MDVAGALYGYVVHDVPIKLGVNETLFDQLGYNFEVVVDFKE